MPDLIEDVAEQMHEGDDNGHVCFFNQYLYCNPENHWECWKDSVGE